MTSSKGKSRGRAQSKRQRLPIKGLEGFFQSHLAELLAVQPPKICFDRRSSLLFKDQQQWRKAERCLFHFVLSLKLDFFANVLGMFPYQDYKK